jgi:hypothetical protein
VITGIEKFLSPVWEKVKDILNKYADVDFPFVGIPDLMRWYSTFVFKPVCEIIKKETGICDSNTAKELEQLLKMV